MKGNIVSEQARREHSFDTADIRIKWSILEGIHHTSAQAQNMISQLLILGAVAAYAVGETVISDVVNGSGLGRDTFTAFANGLEIFGTHVGEYADGIVLKGGQELRGELVDSGGMADLALALVVVGLNAAGKTTVFGFNGNTYPVNEFMKIINELSSG